MSPVQDGMKLQPGQAGLLAGALFVTLLCLGSTANAPTSVIQKPTLVNITEGSTLNIECKVNGNLTGLSSIGWYKYRCNQEKLRDSSQIQITRNEKERTSHFSLKRADIQDAGTYVCCFDDLEHGKHVPGNGTQVVIREITDLMVNQTPGEIGEMEGGNVTLKCRFETVGNLSNMYARWDKNGKPLSNLNGELTITVDLEQGFTSLTLWKARKSDSGSYTCAVGRTDRSLTGNGTESRVVISEHEKTTEKSGTEQRKETEAGAGFETGLAAGVTGGLLLFLLLIAVAVWRHKKRNKRTPIATSETESVPSDAARKQHLPLASQASDVTYADLHFHKRAAQPEPDVIYAEVRPGRKK